MNEVSEWGVILGKYRCRRWHDQVVFYFELAGDGTYTLQEDSGTYEISDQNTITFISDGFDGVSGWVHQGFMGLTQVVIALKIPSTRCGSARVDSYPKSGQ
jgi:hypothetical protein